MGIVVDIALVICVLVLATIVLFCALTARFILLVRKPGALMCSMRVPGHKWKRGILLLSPEHIDWYGTRGILLRPRVRCGRENFELISHEAPTPVSSHASDKEEAALRPTSVRSDAVIVAHVRMCDSQRDVAMVSPSFAGLVSWIDAAPPSEEPLFL